MAKKKQTKLDREKIELLCAEIAEKNTPRHRENLLDRLETEEGLKIKEVTGTYKVTMCGLTATGTAGPHMALTNWANAARRALLKA